jgi:hypothetical protein
MMSSFVATSNIDYRGQVPAFGEARQKPPRLKRLSQISCAFMGSLDGNFVPQQEFFVRLFLTLIFPR